jgi:FkbM family methyltransferase
VPRLSTAAKITIARVLRRGVGAWLSIRGIDAKNVVCDRHGVTWSLDVDEGVQLALYLGQYERTTIRALARLARPDAIAIDIGANIGAQALPLASRLSQGGRLIAVEPADSAMARLKANCALNPQLASRITLVHSALGAAGDAASESYFASWPLDPAGNAHPVHQGAPQRSTATAATVDDLVRQLGLPRVDLIKLDVDGNELPILRGARETLTRYQPKVVFELCPYLLEERGESPSALTRQFTALGYKLFDERTFAPVSPDENELLATIPSGGSMNLIASMTPLSSTP